MTDDATSGPGSRRTGHPAVDSTLDRLDQLGSAPPAEQVRGLDEVHRLLHDALADQPED